MSSAEFGWESLLRTDAPAGCALKAALFTTYDRADERLLVEDLLKLLLKLDREPDGEGAERQYFLLELDWRLKQMHDQLVVISSTAREEPEDAEMADSGAYGWIWRSIRRLTVGSHGKAVQHAKLWLLHWGAPKEDGVEYLEIVVSSANLTRAGFKGQLQAGWRACIELRPQRSQSRLDGWGVLPHFLRELAKSAGDDGRIEPFVKILARGKCPEGVTFVASVPGTHSPQVLRRTPWGAAGLRNIAPSGRGAVSVSILSPFIGSWCTPALNQWCDMFDGSPDRLDLVWIDKNHPWASHGRWLLPEATLKTLTELRATLLQLRHDPNDPMETDLFHEKHRPADDRWGHAKAYSFKRGKSRRVLVTSANFSTAAWGKWNKDGELIIENFELGVCIEPATWPFDHLEAFDGNQEPATVSELELPRQGTLIMWARAVWDGKKVDVDCRCEAGREIGGELDSGGERTPITEWANKADGLRSANVLWADSKRPPSLVQLMCEHERLRVPVFDERPSRRDREGTIPPEVDENAAERRDKLLFEQYGGRVAADDDGEGPTDVPGVEGPSSEPTPGEGGDEPKDTGAGRSDSYAVPAWVLARRHLGVVDKWADRVKHAAKPWTQDFEWEVLQRDGELLIEAFQRQAGRDEKKGSAWAIGAKLAAEELTIRLKHFPEA
ncbi:MAG TPA: hypothetical protein VMV69_12940 [Pirellulales bacterium]|nr:hypothetical protein [Pirellulales bacterium]